MTDRDLIERMSRAARPTLFDAACEPDLLFALVLSNLMSPALWAFRAAIEDSAAAQGDGDRQTALIEQIHRYVNDHFFHLLPLDIAEVWGLIDLEEERQRLGRRLIDDALEVITQEFRTREAYGQNVDRLNVFPLIERGKFPDYSYSTLDVLRAERRILQRKKHKPLGVTCCADEAALFSALAGVLGVVRFDELIMFGSVAHYTAFLHHDRRACWFNGKPEYFLPETWARLRAGGPGSQEAFDARLSSLDRIITPAGTWLLRDGCCTIEPDRLAEIEGTLADFFGTELRQLREARARPIRYGRDPLSGFCFMPLDGLSDHDEAARALRAMAAEHPGTILEAAFYAFRDLSVRHPQAYVRAALRGHKVRAAAEGVRGLQDAVAIVRAIEGSESIFGTRARISLPDEVLKLSTGSDRDKALLLYALVQHAPGIAPADRRNTAILLTDGDSFVGAAGAYISTRTFESCARIEEPVTLRLAEPAAAGPRHHS